MNVLVVGAGRFGRATAEAFLEFRAAFHDVAITNLKSEGTVGLIPGLRRATNLAEECPDIVILSYSAVPREVRAKLVQDAANIAAFWDEERRYNRTFLASMLGFLDAWPWKLLIIETNPVDDWVNALIKMYKGRRIVGLGSAFDSQRVRALMAAMCPRSEAKVFRSVRVVGGHGKPIPVMGDRIAPELGQVATWMSNALSIAFVNAPDHIARVWWQRVAIRPLVVGLSGTRSRTHLVVPVRCSGIRAAGAFDVVVEGLEITVQRPRRVSAAEQQQLIEYLRAMSEIGDRLANELASLRRVANADTGEGIPLSERQPNIELTYRLRRSARS